MLRLFLLFTVVPLIELALLIKLGQYTSLGITIAIVVLTGALGAALARHQGLKTWQRIQEQFGRGVMPADELLEGLLILLAGAVLVTPGLLTDAFGFSLLMPPVRRYFRRVLSGYFERRMVVLGPHEQPRPVEHDVIDLPPGPGST